VLVVVLASFLRAQTYSVGSGSGEKPQSNDNKSSSKQSSTKQSLGWGSNIQNARLARAAEEALKRGNYAAAVNYAQRAAQTAPNDPQLWFLLGYAARLNGKSQLSIDSYNHGLRLNPSSLDGISGLAQTYRNLGHNDEAERLLQQVIAADPKRVGDTLLLAEILMNSADYQDAIALLGRAEQIEPGARSEVLLALCYEHMKQLDEANRYLNLAKQRAPDNPEVLRSLGGYYRETDNYAAAITSLKAIRHPPPDVRAELAYTYQLDGQQDEAAKIYVEVANAQPGNLAMQLSAAQAEVATGALDRADPFLKRATAIDPDHYRLHAIQGEIARLQERNEDAVREYNAALEHLPQAPPEGPLYSIQLHVNLAELNKSLGDTARSDQQLEIAKAAIARLDERGPSRPQFLRLRAQINMAAGNLDDAGNDIKEALAINAKDPNNLQLDGDLLVKLGQTDQAVAVYKQILAIDANSRSALTSLGYVSREAGRDQEAEKYFQRLASAYPNLYVPYLALGDLYTSRKDYAKAEAAYRKGNALAPGNSLIVAGGMNAAVEQHRLPLAAEWLARATPAMQQEPHIMREKERYLSFKQDYKQSAEVGREAIKKLPRDRDVVVYLGYDLLYLNEYDELEKLTSQYEQILPKEPDIPLLAGYVHKRAGLSDQARQDFTEALQRDPNVATAYVNRGFILHDLRESTSAAADFETALKLEPKNGEAHLGLAYASLDLHRPKTALREVQIAEDELGESMPIHLICATAYGENGMLTKASREYRVALKYAPNDGGLHVALADTLYGLHHYHESVDELTLAQKLSPDDAVVYARLARSYAQLRDKDQTFKNVQLAEDGAKLPPPAGTKQKLSESDVFVSTGQALALLGDQKAAMERFERALAVAGNDRMTVRLAVAHLMVEESQTDDARRQIALALMEARAGESLPPTGEQLLEAADVFLGVHDYELAQKYFQYALAAGAPDAQVRIGLANSYLATGDTTRAQGQIALIDNSGDSEPSYPYLLAQANVFRQEHQNVQALTAFAQAANAAGEDQAAEQDLLQAGANEGWRVNQKLSLLSDFSVEPIFEDTTVYPLDAKLDVLHPIPGRQSLLPLPRSSIQTQWTGAYHLHLNNVPDITGFFQVRNARGQISLPSADTIVNRDTTDYSFNIGLNPVLHLGNNLFTFNSGIQETIRRDSLSPLEMNQNLFRQFVYMSTSSFFNMVSVSGFAIREAGPFTESNLSSRDLSGEVDFRVGRPWGKNALVTGWGARDDQFFPLSREFYFTSSYIGVERRFSPRLTLRAVAEDVRAWRVEGNAFAIAQALRPAGSVEFKPTLHWSFQASGAYSRNMSFHAYDAVQAGFAVSYGMAVHHQFQSENNSVELEYPIRFSAGMQQEDFFNFAGPQTLQLRPYIRVDLF